MANSEFKSFVRAENVKAGTTGKRSMGGIEAHAKRLDKTALLRRVREIDPMAWSKVGAGINSGGCDIWDSFKAHKADTGAVERGGASLALHMLIGVSREWLEEDGRKPNSEENDRIQMLFKEAKAWVESWAGDGSVIHTRFDLDERGSGNVDVVVVPARLQRRKTRKKAATKEVLTISTRMAKEELRKSLDARTSGQAMQTSWNAWCKERLDLRIARGTSKDKTQREHIHSDILRGEADKLRSEKNAAKQSHVKYDEAVRQLDEEKHLELEQAREVGKSEGLSVVDVLLKWSRSAIGPHNGLILDGLTELEERAYLLHRKVVEHLHYAKQSEKEGRLSLEQTRFLRARREAQPDPDRYVCEDMMKELRVSGLNLDLIERISAMVKRLLQRMVEAVKPHLLEFWTSERGGYKWDVEEAGSFLGAAELASLELSVEQEAEELRNAEPVFRKLAEREIGMDY